MSHFLTRDEIKELTDFSTKATQIRQLRAMGIPFFVNGSGWPVVTVAAVEGTRQEVPRQQAWTPAVLQGGKQGG